MAKTLTESDPYGLVVSVSGQKHEDNTESELSEHQRLSFHK